MRAVDVVDAVENAVVAAEEPSVVDVVPLGKPSARAVINGGGTHFADAW